MTNNTHIKTIQHAINLLNKPSPDNYLRANHHKQLKVMQAKSKNIKSRTNKHKSKQDKLIEREQERDDPEDELDHLEIDGAPNDYEDNLTYHEDSLSIFRGTIQLPGAENLRGSRQNMNTQKIQVWVTADNGAMTQLADRRFVEQTGIKTEPLPRDKYFYIVGPGGGRSKITQRITLNVDVEMNKVLRSVDDYTTGEHVHEVSAPETKTIRMTFGVSDNLPVPLLWGGGQMRRKDLIDHHKRKTLSLLVDSERWEMPSMSWLVASSQMKVVVDQPAYHGLKEFIPTKERLVNICHGGRVAHNMSGILTPGRQSVVRLSRHNAQVDEGYNFVEVLNEEEVERTWGNKLIICPSASTGEAFLIV